ncbi:MAG: hypothetical protein WA364_25810 [Candidatus Nitrosopolaris sp.]
MNKFCKPKADGNVSKSMFVGMDVHKNYLGSGLDEKGSEIMNWSTLSSK